MAIILNTDKDNYFVVANEPYNIIANNTLVFAVYRGQYFKWSSKYIPVNKTCSSCSKDKAYYTLTGYSNCDEGFKDELLIPKMKMEYVRVGLKKQEGITKMYLHLHI